MNDDLWGPLLAERHALIFLYPSKVRHLDWHRDFTAAAGRLPMETAVAVSRLIFDRVLERFDLTRCLALALRPDHTGPGKLVTTALWLVSIFVRLRHAVRRHLGGNPAATSQSGVPATGFGVLAGRRARSA